MRMELQGDGKVWSKEEEQLHDMTCQREEEAGRERRRIKEDGLASCHSVTIVGPCGSPSDMKEVQGLFQKQDETNGAAGIDRIAMRAPWLASCKKKPFVFEFRKNPFILLFVYTT